MLLHQGLMEFHTKCIKRVPNSCNDKVQGKSTFPNQKHHPKIRSQISDQLLF